MATQTHGDFSGWSTLADASEADRQEQMSKQYSELATDVAIHPFSLLANVQPVT